MKKTFATIFIVIILINFICTNVFAGDIERTNVGDIYESQDSGRTTGYMETGEAQVGEEGTPIKMDRNKFKTQGSAAVNVLTMFIIGIPHISTVIMSNVVSEKTPDNLEPGEISSNIFSIEKLVFNSYEYFDVNFFDKEVESNTVKDEDKTNEVIKDMVANWYFAIRNLVIVASLCVLIYIAINIALSSTPSKKAEYKKKLMNWLVSFVLIFVLHYLLIAAHYMASSLTGLVLPKEMKNFEPTIVGGIIRTILEAKGFDKIMSVMIYLVIVYYQLRFFVFYFKRLFTMSTLLILSPIILITYPIDKIGDDKSQAFTTLIKEYLINLFIQPIHAFIYVVFIYSANEIMMTAPVIAIFMFASLSRVEKIVKQIFNMRGRKTINSLGAVLQITKIKRFFK